MIQFPSGNDHCVFVIYVCVCKFKDICYMTEKDIVRLKDIDNLDFLGGDNNA